jgi:hypothetical protein
MSQRMGKDIPLFWFFIREDSKLEMPGPST